MRGRFTDIAKKISAAAQLLDKDGALDLATSADMLAEVVEAGLQYIFEVYATKNASDTLNGTYRVHVGRDKEEDRSTIRIDVYGEGLIHTYSADDDGFAKTLADTYDGKTEMLRVRISPVSGNRSSGPQAKLMMSIKEIGVIEQNTSTSKPKPVTSTTKLTVSSAISYLMGLKEEAGLEITSVIRPKPNTVVIQTLDGEGAVFSFKDKSEPGKVKFSVLTKDGTYAGEVDSLRAFEAKVDELLA
jgi:hypothetical protein